MQESVQPFDWERMLIDQFPWTYLGEVAFRTVFMFLVLLMATCQLPALPALQ